MRFQPPTPTLQKTKSQPPLLSNIPQRNTIPMPLWSESSVHGSIHKDTLTKHPMMFCGHFYG